MIWFLYNVIFAVGYTLMLPKFLMRMVKRGGYSDGFMQRFGCYSPEVRKSLTDRDKRIWVHAVSVGEVFVALRFMDEMRASNEGQLFILTVTTSTGQDVARKNMNENDILLYFPVDFPLVVNRVLKVLSPSALVLTECEIWPNLIRAASKRGIPVMIINGRISDASYRGYNALSFFARRIIGMIDLLLVQTEADSARLIELGADESRVHVMGSGKYDVVNMDCDGEDQARRLLDECGMTCDDTVILGGSTWPGEEKALLGVYSRLKREFPVVRLVLVPRHAERRDEVKAEITSLGLSCLKRSTMESTSKNDGDVLLVDTTGELKNLYACSDLIFVGKSLTEHGGQNFIEPAFYGKPIITGPNLENFPVVAKDFISNEAIVQVQDEADLEDAFRKLLKDDEMRSELGRKAKAVVSERTGVVGRSVKMMLALIS